MRYQNFTKFVFRILSDNDIFSICRIRLNSAFLYTFFVFSHLSREMYILHFRIKKEIERPKSIAQLVEMQIYGRYVGKNRLELS